MMYVILASEINAMKIGISRDPRRRLKDLQTSVPYALEILYVLPDAWLKEEREFHCSLREHSLNGEWFKVTPESLQSLQSLLSGHRLLGADELALPAPQPITRRSPPTHSPPPDPSPCEQPDLVALDDFYEQYPFPYDVTSRKDIKAGPKVLYLAMLDLSRMGHENPTLEYLSSYINTPKRTVARLHKILEEKGLIPLEDGISLSRLKRKKSTRRRSGGSASHPKPST